MIELAYALRRLVEVWPEYGCRGAGCVVGPGPDNLCVGTCRCVREPPGDTLSRGQLRAMLIQAGEVVRNVPEASDPLTVALAVALDLAEEQEEIPLDLQRQVAAHLPKMRIATGWVHSSKHADRYLLNNTLAARVWKPEGPPFTALCNVEPRDSRKFETFVDARTWADVALEERDHFLVGDR